MSNGTSGGGGGTTQQGGGFNWSAAGQSMGSGDVLSSLQQAGRSTYELIQGPQESEVSKKARQLWERSVPSAEATIRQTYYLPFLQGRYAPYGSTGYAWNPPESQIGLYQNYLGRTYGIPQSTANIMAAQAIQPIRPTVPGGRASPAQIASGLQLSPQQFAQSMVETLKPDVMRQQDYLQNAVRLASFNLKRSQMLQNLIG